MGYIGIRLVYLEDGILGLVRVDFLKKKIRNMLPDIWGYMGTTRQGTNISRKKEKAPFKEKQFQGGIKNHL